MQRSILAAVILVVCGWAQAQDIRHDTTWDGQRTIDQAVVLVKGTLTIEPGAQLTFSQGGSIRLGSGAVLLAKGTVQKPISFRAERVGQITGQGQAHFEHCDFTGLGEPVLKDKPSRWLQVTTAGEGIVLQDCRVTDCSGAQIDGKKPCEISGCDFRDGRGDLRITAATVRIENNTLKGTSLDGSIAESAVIRGNVIVDGTIGGFSPFQLSRKEFTEADRKDAKARRGNVLIEGNYVHRAQSKGTYCLVWVGGTIRENLLRGGAWVTASLTGHVKGNVFESIPAKAFKDAGGINGGGTHEHICGLLPDAVIERNIFVHPSYGAIMGIGGNTCTGALIRNNTFDMRGAGDPIFLNHLPANDPKGIIIRNNMFLRGRNVASERNIVDSIAFCDYNLWAPSHASGRFALITMTGRKQGDEGFGRHDVPTTSPASPAGDLKVQDLIQDAQFEFPYTDDELLARKRSVADCLALYRKAYALKPGCAAIDAGDPQDKDDSDVTDGRCDIGAVEFVNPTTRPATSSAVSGK